MVFRVLTAFALLALAGCAPASTDYVEPAGGGWLGAVVAPRSVAATPAPEPPRLEDQAQDFGGGFRGQLRRMGPTRFTETNETVAMGRFSMLGAPLLNDTGALIAAGAEACRRNRDVILTRSMEAGGSYEKIAIIFQWGDGPSFSWLYGAGGCAPVSG